MEVNRDRWTKYNIDAMSIVVRNTTVQWQDEFYYIWYIANAECRSILTIGPRNELYTL